NVICERDLFERVGEFDPTLSQCADWDMWIRLGAVTDFIYLDEPLVQYRQHESSMSRNPELLERDSIRVLEKGVSMPQADAHISARRGEGMARNYMVLAGTYFRAHRYGDFMRCATRSVRLEPRRAGYLAAFPLRAARRRSKGAVA